jgi:hypothetical protein
MMSVFKRHFSPLSFVLLAAANRSKFRLRAGTEGGREDMKKTEEKKALVQLGYRPQTALPQ